MNLDYGLKSDYDVTVNVNDPTATDAVQTPLTLFYDAATGSLVLRNTTS